MANQTVVLGQRLEIVVQVLVLSVPSFVSLKNGKANSPAPNTEEGGAS